MNPIHFTPTPAQQASIEALLQQQGNATPTAFIAEAVERYIAEQTAFSRLKQEIQRGVDCVERGDVVECTLESIMAEVAARQQRGEKRHRDSFVTGE
jgi:hypothetical protein